MYTVKLSPNCTIILADCRDVIPTLKGEFDAVITDPPYGINFKMGTSSKDWGPRNLKPIIGDDKLFNPAHLLELQVTPTGGCNCREGQTKTGIPMAICGANHFAQYLPVGTGSWLCWDKSCGQGATANFSDAEFIWANRTIKRCIFRHLWMGLLRAGQDSPSRTRRTHPSLKPVELMTWLIESIRVGLGKTVLDPYMGVGSTGVACLQTGRKFIGIELDPEYFEIARARLQREIDQQSECFDFGVDVLEVPAEAVA